MPDYADLPSAKPLGLHSGKWLGREWRRGREEGQLGVMQGALVQEMLGLRTFPECHLVAKGREMGTEVAVGGWSSQRPTAPDLGSCARESTVQGATHR